MKYPAIIVLLAIVAVPFPSFAEKVVVSEKHHAHGTFTVEVQPVKPAPAVGLSRYAMKKVIHGDLEGSSTGEMFSGGDPALGLAGYVAIELVTGTMNGRHGSFALQQMATMDSSGSHLSIVVVPGSGIGDFKGITGTFTIQVADDRHAYDLDYALPVEK